MVFDFGVEQLVEQHVVDKFVGQCHQFHVEADVVGGGAAAPAAYLVADGHSVEGEVVLTGKFAEAAGQFFAGLFLVYGW